MEPLGQSLAASQPADTSTEVLHTPEGIKTTTSETRTGDEGMTLAAPAVAASSSMLPIELLIDIFRHLSPDDVARSSRVCSIWHAASKEAHLWRQISFPETKRADLLFSEVHKLLQLERFWSFIERCDDTIESVDFARHLPLAVEDLAQDLIGCAATLKHIRWSTDPGFEASIWAAAGLARHCAQLETLELRVLQLTRALDLEAGEPETGIPNYARPRHFSLIVYRSSHAPRTFTYPTRLFDRATTIEIKYSDCLESDNPGPLMRVFTFCRLLLGNPALEKLAVHALEHDVEVGPTFISAPSLTSLDLRFSKCRLSTVMIDAPKLRELAVEGYLLSRFTPRSLASLSSLHLRLTGEDVDLLDIIERAKGHKGRLRLLISASSAELVLARLSEEFFWPGLEELEIELTARMVRPLINVMAAREIGARGASREQYLETIRMVPMLLHSEEARSKVGGLDGAMAVVRALPPDGTAPLCSQVHWKVKDAKNNAADGGCVLWLDRQPNVTVKRRSGLDKLWR